MSASKTNIFITGATGYIGGSVFQRLVQHPNAANFNLTALVRSPEKAKFVRENFPVNVVEGSNADLDKLTDLSERADVVLNIADSDDLAAANAIMQGLKRRHEKTGVKPTLIHTSGTGFLVDDARGMFSTDKIYHDSKPEEIENGVPDSALHRNVDLAVIDADRKGWLRGLIISPPTIFGMGSGPLFDSGLVNKHSLQIPLLIKISLARGRGAGVVGEGKSIWNHVHIDDVADSYIVLLDAVLKNPDTIPHGREGIYLLENGEHTWIDVSKAVGKAFVQLGLAKSAKPVPFTEAELQKYIGSSFMGYLALGSNARGRAEQIRTLGWKPKYTTADLFANIKPEVQAHAPAKKPFVQRVAVKFQQIFH
ncbi:NAD-P-binding protein [Trametes coccinea BRFM310]|uniref:NAD-P-binding protein n=1 Tax=Trametes coccinea (strain BRFM310) TaxID=1353009 RepID=A0A1Y2J970_TRAC3|nr:NAD-P-binding protein [Trametes coccinea BRFM310]